MAFGKSEYLPYGSDTYPKTPNPLPAKDYSIDELGNEVSSDSNRERADSDQKKSYTEEEKGETTSSTRKRTEENTKDKWNKKEADKALKHYGKNEAKDPSYGRLNGKSFKNTRNLSRLADALNNRMHFGPASTGYRTNSKFGSNEGNNQAEAKRWAPIETQEMRQMRADEAVDAQMRRDAVTQQSNVNNYALELQRKVDDNTAQIAAAIGMSDVQVKEALRRACIDIDYKLPATTKMQLITTRFLNEMQLETKSKACVYAYQIWKDNAALGALFMQSMAGGNLNMNDMLQSQIWDQIFKDPKYADLDPMQKMQAMTAIQSGVGAAWAAVMSQGLGTAFKQGISGFFSGAFGGS